MDGKCALVFSFLNSKYQSWWRRRVDTEEKLEAEVVAWSAALAPYSVAQIRAAFVLIQRGERGARLSPPPSPEKFVAAIVKQQARPVDPFYRRRRVDRPVRSAASCEFFESVRKCL